MFFQELQEEEELGYANGMFYDIPLKKAQPPRKMTNRLHLGANQFVTAYRGEGEGNRLVFKDHYFK